MSDAELSTVVTFNPLAVRGETLLIELIQQWATDLFHHWPVVDDESRVSGIVSERDLARVTTQWLDDAPANEERTADAFAALTADEVMTKDVIAISRWETQQTALYYLLKHRVHALPVVDGDQLVGVVTSTDFLREFSYGDRSVSRQPVSEWVGTATDPIEADQSLESASRMLQERGCQELGVVHGTLPLGAVTARDLRAAELRTQLNPLFNFTFNGPTSLSAIAAKSPTVRPGARLSEAAKLMVEHRRQAIAVVNQAGRMVGVLSEEAILRAMAGRRLPVEITDGGSSAETHLAAGSSRTCWK